MSLKQRGTLVQTTLSVLFEKHYYQSFFQYFIGSRRRPARLRSPSELTGVLLYPGLKLYLLINPYPMLMLSM